MPLYAPGIGVVSGTDPVTVDVLQFVGAGVQVSQSDDTMVVIVSGGLQPGSGMGVKYPTFPVDDGWIHNILTATNATSSLWQTEQGTAPFWSGQTWWRDSSETWKIREDVNVSGGNIFPTVQRFKFYDLLAGNVFQFYDTITYQNGVFEASRLRTLDGYMSPQFTIYPTTGSYAQQAYITGVNFMPGVVVAFNPTASLNAVKHNSASFIIPSFSLGDTFVTATNIDGRFGTAPFKMIQSIPKITSVIPATNLIPGSGSFVMNGTSFFSGVTTVIGTSSLSSTLFGETVLSESAPPSITFVDGTKRFITVTNLDGGQAFATATMVYTTSSVGVNDFSSSINLGTYTSFIDSGNGNYYLSYPGGTQFFGQFVAMVPATMSAGTAVFAGASMTSSARLRWTGGEDFNTGQYTSLWTIIGFAAYDDGDDLSLGPQGIYFSIGKDDWGLGWTDLYCVRYDQDGNQNVKLTNYFFTNETHNLNLSLDKNGVANYAVDGTPYSFTSSLNFNKPLRPIFGTYAAGHNLGIPGTFEQWPVVWNSYLHDTSVSMTFNP